MDYKRTRTKGERKALSCSEFKQEVNGFIVIAPCVLMLNRCKHECERMKMYRLTVISCRTVGEGGMQLKSISTKTVILQKYSL